MEDFYDMIDPRRSGVEGLKGINTNAGKSRLAQELGLPTTVEEYRMNAATQGMNYTQPIDIGDYGKYAVDRRIQNPIDLEDLSDARGRYQTSTQQILNGIGKAGVLTATTVGNTIGSFFGIIEAIANNDFSKVYDNEITRAMDAVNKWSEDVMPNFYTNDQRENPLALRNLLSANTLGDKFIKNLGFSIGSALVGMYGGGAIRGLAGAAKLGGLVQNASNASKVTASLVGAMLASVGESSFEAQQTMQEFLEPYEQEHMQRLDYIGKMYQNSPLLVQMLNEETQRYNKQMAELKQYADRAGDADFFMNMLILPASNYVMFGKAFARGFKTAEKQATKLTGKRLTASMIEGQLPQFEATGSTMKGAASAAFPFFTEGSEEWLQRAATNTALNYQRAKYLNDINEARMDPEAQEKVVSFMQTLGKTILQTAGEDSAWEEFLIGGLTGITGIPMIRFGRNSNGKVRPHVYMEGNAFTEFNNYMRAKDEAEMLAQQMNRVASTPEYRTLFQGLIANEALQNDMDLAAAEGDAYSYKNAEFMSLANIVDTFAKAGRLNDLNTILDMAFDTSSDKNIQGIIDATTSITKDEDGKDVLNGPFVEHNQKMDISDAVTKEEVVNILNKKKEEISKIIDFYKKTSKQLDNVRGQHFTDDQRSELMWLYLQLNNFRDRALQMTNDQILPVLEDLQSNFNVIKGLFERDVEKAEDNEKESLNEAIKNVDSYINFLNRIINSKAENVVDLLFTDKVFDEKLGQISGIKSLIDNYAEKFGIDTNEINDALSALGDINKMAKVFNRSQEKLKEYLETPSKIDKVKEAIIDKAQKGEKSYKGRKLKDALNKTTTVKDFRQTLNKSKESDDIKDQIINELKESNPVAKRYAELEIAKAAVDEEIDKLNIEDTQIFGDVTNLLNQAYYASDSVDFYTNITAEPYYITDYLTDRESDPEEIKKRHQAALSYIHKAFEEYHKNKNEAEALKNNKVSEEEKKKAKSKETTEGIREGENGAGTIIDEGDDGSFTIFDADEKKKPKNPQPLVDTSDTEISDPMLDDSTLQGALSIVSDAMEAGDETSLITSKPKENKGYWQGYTSVYDYTKKPITFNPKTGKFSFHKDAYTPVKRFDKLRKYLKEGIDYVDSGKLKAGDTIYIGMHTVETDGSPTRYLIAYKEEDGRMIPLNNITGYTTGEAMKLNIGLKSMYEKISSEYDEFISKPENEGKEYIPKTKETTTSVAYIFLGRLHANDVAQDINNIIENTKKIDDSFEPIFGILREGRIDFGVLNGVDKDGIIYDEQALEPIDKGKNIGRVYIAIPNAARGTASGVNLMPIVVKKLDKDVASTPFYGERIIKEVDLLKEAFRNNDDDLFREHLKELGKYVNLGGYDIVLDTRDQVVRINKFQRDKDGRKVVKDGKFAYKKGSMQAIPIGRADEFDEWFINTLINNGVRYNVNAKDINKTINGKSYNQIIIDSGILSAYAVDFTSRGGWFAINPIIDGEEIQAYDLPISDYSRSYKKEDTKALVETPPQPKSKVTNDITLDTVSKSLPTFTYNGKEYTLKDNKVYDENGMQVTKGPHTETLFAFAMAASGKTMTFSNGRYAYVDTMRGPVVLDLVNGVKLSKLSDEYKQIYRIANLASYSNNELIDEAIQIENSDVARVFDEIGSEINAYIAPNGELHSNYLYEVGEYKGHKIYVTVEPHYGENEEFVDIFDIYFVVDNGYAVRANTVNTTEVTLDTEKLEQIFDGVTTGKSKNTIARLDKVIGLDSIYEKKDSPTALPVNPDEIKTEENNGGIPNIEITDEMLKAFEDGTFDDTQANPDEVFRIVEGKKDIFDKSKETQWLENVLPNLSSSDRIQFIDGLIPVMQSGKKAWGKFDGAMMTISNVAAKGTIYHEAFHSVFWMLMDESKRNEIFNEAREQYGRDKTELELEELLADAFMIYVENSQKKQSLIRRFFNRLKIKKDNWRQMRPYLNALFNDINNGKYGNLKPNSVKLDVSRYGAEEYTQEMRDILKNAPRDKEGYLLAPNGQRSKLNERQYVHVRTKAFLNWFGDWINDPQNASKVVDPDTKEPMVVYHTGNENILEFKETEDFEITKDFSSIYNKTIEDIENAGFQIIDQQREEYEKTGETIVSRPNAIYTTDSEYMSSSYRPTEAEMWTQWQIQHEASSMKEKKRLIKEGYQDLFDKYVKLFNIGGIDSIKKDPDFIRHLEDVTSIQDFITNNNIDISELKDKAELDYFSYNYAQLMFNEKHAKDFENPYKYNPEKIANGDIYGLFNNIRKPLVVEGKDANWNDILFEGKKVSTRDLEVISRQRGYDGVIIRNIYDYGGHGDPYFIEPADVFITHSKFNVKSATDNIGTYDKNNPDIRYRLADESEIQELINDGHSREFISKANNDLLEVMKTCAGIA